MFGLRVQTTLLTYSCHERVVENISFASSCNLDQGRYLGRIGTGWGGRLVPSVRHYYGSVCSDLWIRLGDRPVVGPFVQVTSTFVQRTLLIPGLSGPVEWSSVYTVVPRPQVWVKTNRLRFRGDRERYVHVYYGELSGSHVFPKTERKGSVRTNPVYPYRPVLLG